MDNQTEKLPVTADAAEAEKVEAAAELGKFKSVKALLDAYTALEAEFTRRSQRLKELEANKEQSAPVNAASAEALSQASVVSEEIKDAVIREYLNGVQTSRAVPFVTGGGAVGAVRRTPSTLSEAGGLARKYLDKKED